MSSWLKHTEVLPVYFLEAALLVPASFGRMVVGFFKSLLLSYSLASLAVVGCSCLICIKNDEASFQVLFMTFTVVLGICFFYSIEYLCFLLLILSLFD